VYPHCPGISATARLSKIEPAHSSSLLVTSIADLLSIINRQIDDSGSRRLTMVNSTPNKRAVFTFQELVSPSPLPETPKNLNSSSQQPISPVTANGLSEARVPLTFHSPSDSSGDTEIEDEDLTEDEGDKENEDDEEGEKDEQDEDNKEDVNQMSSAEQTDGPGQVQSSANEATLKNWWAYPARVNGKPPKQRSVSSIRSIFIESI
jgi:hypothetical protein